MLVATNVLHIIFTATRGIRHLELQNAHMDCRCLSSALSVLKHLQTLCLVHAGEPVQQTSGALHVADLEHLHGMTLDQVVPDSISLSAACELHLKLHCPWSAQHTVWDTVLPYLRSVVLWLSAHDLEALPSMLLNQGSLRKAVLVVGTFGTAASPLQLHGALAQLQELRVHATHLHAIVPTDVGWRNVTLAADNVLDLRFADIVSFAVNVPAFYFRYSHLQVMFCPPAQPCLSEMFFLHQPAPCVFREQHCWKRRLSWQNGTWSGPGPLMMIQ